MSVQAIVIDCPDCKRFCQWCSWKASNARSAGCGAQWHRKKIVPKCPFEALKDTVCPTCNGSEKLDAELRIKGPHTARVPAEYLERGNG